RRSPHAVFPLCASGHRGRDPLRGGRQAARAGRADGLPLPLGLREGQRASGAGGTRGGAHQASGAGACYFRFLSACARRLLWRSPAFRCITPFATTRSMTRCESRSTVAAAALSPPATAFFTFLIAVRTAVRRLMLCTRRTCAWRA